MKLLLDTHVWLWWLAGEPLSSGAADAISNADNDVYLSSVSVWEAMIKASIGKLDVPADLMDASTQFDELPVTWAHAAAVRELPLHHRDPFDRLLIAQARVESATLVTRDCTFEAYGVDVTWA